MESCWFASLVDHRSHQNLATLEPEMKMAAEGLTLIHQALSVLVPVTLSNWYRSLSPLSSPVPQPLAMSLSTPIICSPSPSRYTQRLIAPVKRKETRDFGYGLFPLRPIMSSLLALSCVWPNKVFLQKPRSDQNPSLSIFSKRWCRFMEPVVQG
ncbi:hypothetical protein ARALYDRAFT_901101 [Arabidopsis lyrata subsp. lyrata]|uniref:Uncharacterized protein n=2 Tax=Arabidopsis lyrata subsp. lyrata TaxID=81972 RepID=D7LJH9_ARALL|nr:hypothetical protein ARALYDRAFT_901101 [Arabidopsis lyrata subsp. lyrata]